MSFFFVKIKNLSLKDININNRWKSTIEILKNEEINGRIKIGGILFGNMEIIFFSNINIQELKNLLLNLPIWNYCNINIKLLNTFDEELNLLYIN